MVLECSAVSVSAVALKISVSDIIIITMTSDDSRAEHDQPQA